MIGEIDLFGCEVKKSRKGGGDSVFKIIGASNHCREARADDDFYATPPSAVEMLLDIEKFNHAILEPSCGAGHIAKVLVDHGYDVEARDLVYRGYGRGGCDFLATDNRQWSGDIVMNPPYDLAAEFVAKALSIVKDGAKIAAFLKLTFAEGKKRRELFDKCPPVRCWVSTSRLSCGKNGVEWSPSAVCYAWWIWEKGFKGSTSLKWFN